MYIQPITSTVLDTLALVARLAHVLCCQLSELFVATALLLPKSYRCDWASPYVNCRGHGIVINNSFIHLLESSITALKSSLSSEYFL